MISSLREEAEMLRSRRAVNGSYGSRRDSHSATAEGGVPSTVLTESRILPSLS